MRFSKSALLFLGTLAGSFFPPGVQAQDTSYTDIGNGACNSCDNKVFDFIFLSIKTNTLACESDCETCATNEGALQHLLGFTYKLDGSGDCNCQFDQGATFTGQCSDEGAGALAVDYSNDAAAHGSGEICGVDGDTQYTCYSRVDAVPSSAPSDVPSMKPSDVPSDVPSSKPSDVPSSKPSDVPSSSPSESPSDVPSVVPSDNPSSMPSDLPSVSSAPSDAPSDQPSSTPSSSPSEEPSSEPSSTPSCSPSNSPTASPSVEGGVNLFYPDWANGGETCKNDGAHPDYMEINPTQWMSSTLDACCKKFFGGFLYHQCTGAYPPDADDCTVMLYYPDWNGANEGCVADGQEPLYMLGNANYFLSNNKEDCCKKFYEWNYYPCTGTTPEGSGDYYPDWNNSPATCKADGNMPDYMLSPDRAPWYLFDNLEDCCKKYFNYDLNNCLGSSGTPVTGSNKWYVNYSAKTCVTDCTGISPCGGLVEGSWVETFSSKSACCSAKLWYEADCVRTNA